MKKTNGAAHGRPMTADRVAACATIARELLARAEERAALSASAEPVLTQ